jgi:pimeloyl-ACP methyl ester carboxylesterase
MLALMIRLLIALNLSLFSLNTSGRVEILSIPHPDDPAKKVEFFLEKPSGIGPWPTVVLLHGHQQPPRSGGKDFVNWGVLDRFAERGYLAVAVSQPGYGNSTGLADFCGPFTQRAVQGVIEKLRADGYVDPNKILIEGISRGALVAGLIAAHNPSIAGVVLISGLYNLPKFLAEANSDEAKKVANSIREETGGGESALAERSVLRFVKNILIGA